jgi:hypothetical protein
MKKIIDYITEKAMEENKCGDGFIMYNAWQNLCYQTEAHQQENIILDVINFLYLQNKYSRNAHLDHMKRCPIAVPIINIDWNDK